MTDNQGHIVTHQILQVLQFYRNIRLDYIYIYLTDFLNVQLSQWDILALQHTISHYHTTRVVILRDKIHEIKQNKNVLNTNQ